jgi:hypothetical protein
MKNHIKNQFTNLKMQLNVHTKNPNTIKHQETERKNGKNTIKNVINSLVFSINAHYI